MREGGRDSVSEEWDDANDAAVDLTLSFITRRAAIHDTAAALGSSSPPLLTPVGLTGNTRPSGG